MELQKYRLEFILKAPFLFPSEAVGRYGYDCVTLRDDEGFPVIPRDQMRGLVRHGLIALSKAGNAEAAELLRAFGQEGRDAAPLPNGKESEADDLVGLSRGRVSFSDMVSDQQGVDNLSPIPRVEIENESGAALPGHLAQFEQVALPGTHFKFSGEISIYADIGSDLCSLFRTALSWHGFIGAMKTVGFGELDEATIVCTKLEDPFAYVELVESDLVSWQFTLDRPYLVDAERISENAYRGRRNIPGGVIKGLLAKHLALTGKVSKELSEAITNLRISFATPKGAKPALPLSLLFDPDRGVIIDALNMPEMAKGSEWYKDWKTSAVLDEAKARYWKANTGDEPQSLSEVRFENRIHTAIDATTGAAVDAELFATHAIYPPEAFDATLDFTEVQPEERSFLRAALCGAMLGLGRTDAVLQACSFKAMEVEPTSIEAGNVAMRLTTPGLMIDHSDGKTAFEAYRIFWKGILPDSDLLAAHSDERLVGGYIGHRFGNRDRYRPFLLTGIGSVFHFKIHPQDIDKVITILRSGICRSTLHGISLDWNTCPFTVENGYGALAIHQPYTDEDAHNVS